MQPFVFKNRKTELKILAKFAAKVPDSDQATAAVVYGAEGVGKTTIVGRALEEFFEPEIIIATVKFNPFRTHSDGAYLRTICLELQRTLARMNHTNTLKEFLTESKTNVKISNIARTVGLDLAKKLSGIDSIWEDMREQTRTLSALTDKFFSLSDEESSEFFARYLTFIAKRFYVCIHITNFQCIDNLSLNLLEDYFCEFNFLSFVFEVTHGEEDFRETKLNKRLEYFIPKLYHVPVPPIDISELLDQIIQRPETVVSLIAKSFSRGNGNLRDLERLVSSSETVDQAFSIEKVSSSMLFSRPRNEKVLLCVACLSDGVLTVNDLRSVMRDEPIALHALLKDVTNGKQLGDYITHSDDRLLIDHDSTLRRVLERNEIAFEREYAARLLRDWTVQTQGAPSTLGIDQCLRVLQLSAACSDAEMIEAFLNEIERRFRQNSGFVTVIDEVVKFVNHLALRSPKRYTSLLLAIANLLSRNNLLSNATYMTSAIAEISINGLVCHINALLSSLDLISANAHIDRLEEQVAAMPSTAPERVIATLLRIWWYRLRGELKKARWIYLSINTDRIVNPVLKAAYLRYSEICDLDNAKEYLTEANKLASDQGNALLSVEIKLALALYLGEGGDPAGALDCLTIEAAAFDQISFFHRYAIANNRLASENLLRCPKTPSLLGQLSHGIADPFDRVIVENNLMIADILSNVSEASLQRSFKLIGMIEYIARLESNIRKISYLNLASCFAIYGKADQAAEMWYAQLQIPITIDHWFWDDVTKYENVSTFVAAKLVPFFPPYMTNWSIDPYTLTTCIK